MKTRPPQVRTSLLDAVSHNDLQLKEVTTLRGRRRAGQGVARRRVMLLAIAAMVWAVARAGADRDLVNADGCPSFTRFFRAAFHPNFSGEFVKLAASAASVTLGYAVLGTALSLVLGLIGGFALSERVWEAVAAPTRARRTARVALRRLANDVLILPRSVHEVLWALVLLQIYGFAPIVAVLAIGIPFGAVTAMVFAETIDESDSGVYESLRSSGVGRFAAVAYGIVPVSAGDFISYSFYRFECAIRSAAILGIVGATGLGYQLDLSFKELHYREMWTLIGSLVIIGGAAEILASRIRRRHASGPVRCGDLRITQKRASDQRVFRDSTNMTAPRSSRRDPKVPFGAGRLSPECQPLEKVLIQHQEIRRYRCRVHP